MVVAWHGHLPGRYPSEASPWPNASPLQTMDKNGMRFRNNKMSFYPVLRRSLKAAPPVVRPAVNYANPSAHVGQIRCRWTPLGNWYPSFWLCRGGQVQSGYHLLWAYHPLHPQEEKWFLVWDPLADKRETWLHVGFAHWSIERIVEAKNSAQPRSSALRRL